MKKFFAKFLISIFFTLFVSNGNALANTPQTSLISVIANVQLTGAVQKPGIYKVPSGTRLVDLLVKAGGLKKDAVTTNLNLTSPVTDGTTFYITSKKDLETKPAVNVGKNEISTGDKVTSKKRENKTSRKKKVKKQNHSPIQINLNSATQEELDSLPGIGEGLARVIIKYRTKNGRFKDMAAFNNVPGIGDKKIEKLKNKIIL